MYQLLVKLIVGASLLQLMVPIASLLANAVDEKRLLLSRCPGVEIRSRFDQQSSLLRTKLDPTDFSAVISNLIHNAFEALNERGSIEVSLNESGNDIVVGIKDTGCGMPAHVLDSVRKGQIGLSYMKADGSGLGIPHAKKSVEAWGGSLRIESQVNIGTVVELTLPVVRFPTQPTSRSVGTRILERRRREQPELQVIEQSL